MNKITLSLIFLGLLFLLIFVKVLFFAAAIFFTLLKFIFVAGLISGMIYLVATFKKK